MHARDDATRRVPAGWRASSSVDLVRAEPSFELKGGNLPVSRNVASSLAACSQGSGTALTGRGGGTEPRGSRVTSTPGGVALPPSCPLLVSSSGSGSPPATQPSGVTGEEGSEGGPAAALPPGSGEGKPLSKTGAAAGGAARSPCLAEVESVDACFKSNLSTVAPQSSTPGSPPRAPACPGLSASCSAEFQQFSSSGSAAKRPSPVSLLQRQSVQSRGTSRTGAMALLPPRVSDDSLSGMQCCELEEKSGKCFQEILSLQHQMLNQMQQQQAIQTQLQQTLLLALLPNLAAPVAALPHPSSQPPSIAALGGDGGGSSCHHLDRVLSSSGSRSSSPPQESSTAVQDMLLFLHGGGSGRSQHHF